MDPTKPNDSNHVDNATNTVDQIEKGAHRNQWIVIMQTINCANIFFFFWFWSTVQNDSNDAEPSTGNQADDVLNRLIEKTSTVAEAEAKGHPRNRGKSTNRNHKDGRSNSKAQNNGKHFNGAHAHAKTKATKQHTASTTEFISEAAAADRT